jgi:hypothetical protein
MSYEEKDGWDDLAESGSGIIGQHLKCAKGKWLLDGASPSDNLKICVLMDTAKIGKVQWNDGKIAERNIGPASDRFYAKMQITEDEALSKWNPYIAFQAVYDDGENPHAVLTFTSSSWGGRKAFQNLVDQFVARKRGHYPICVLRAREKKNDPNHNIEPVFGIIGWSPRDNFQDLFGPAGRSAGRDHPCAEHGRPAATGRRAGHDRHLRRYPLLVGDLVNMNARVLSVGVRARRGTWPRQRAGRIARRLSRRLPCSADGTPQRVVRWFQFWVLSAADKRA